MKLEGLEGLTEMEMETGTSKRWRTHAEETARERREGGHIAMACGYGEPFVPFSLFFFVDVDRRSGCMGQAAVAVEVVKMRVGRHNEGVLVGSTCGGREYDGCDGEGGGGRADGV